MRKKKENPTKKLLLVKQMFPLFSIILIINNSFNNNPYISNIKFSS